MRITNFIKKLHYRFFFTNEQYGRKVGVIIGTGCEIGSRNFGSEPYLITIGNHVQVTDNVYFFTHGGGWVFRNEFPEIDFFGKIVIKNNVYIGSGSYILPGVTIEDNVIVGARSVVTKSVPSGMVVAGNPAKIVCAIEDLKQKIIRFNTNTKRMSSTDKRNILKNLSDDKFILKDFLKTNA